MVGTGQGGACVYANGSRGGPSLSRSGPVARPMPEFRELLRARPSATVIAVVRAAHGRSADLRLLGSWGVKEVIVEDQDEVGDIASILRCVGGRHVVGRWETVLPSTLGEPAHAILVAAAEVVVSGGQSKELARALHLSPRTLVRRCESTALPPPGQILGWMRILRATELLRDRDLSVESIAATCGYASRAGLHRAIGRLIGTTPGAMREDGASDGILHLFARAMCMAEAAMTDTDRRSSPLCPKLVADWEARLAG